MLLNCLVDGDPIKNVFSVVVEPTLTVSELKKVVYAKKQNTLRNLDASDIQLWWINHPVGDKQEILNLVMLPAFPMGLFGRNTLSDHWPDEPPARSIHIIVVPPASHTSSAELKKRKFQEEEGWSEQESLMHKRQKLIEGTYAVVFSANMLTSLSIEQEQHAEKYRMMVAASSAATVENFKRIQNDSPVYNGRPFETSGPPVALFHHVFGQFLADLNSEDLDVPSACYHQTQQFMLAATAIYATETDRWLELKEPLQKLLGCPIDRAFMGERGSCDGVIRSNTRQDLTALRGILKLKNEIGEGGCDPGIQGAFSYVKYCSQLEYEAIRLSSCCPAFVIAIAGPWISIHSSVFANEAIVQPLTDYISLVPGRHDCRGYIKAARLFYALSRSLGTLDDFYASLDTNAPQSPDHFFPYLRNYHSDNKLCHFSYAEPLTGFSKLLWKAVTSEGFPIVVKFTERYNPQAHRSLAEVNLAPQLLYVSGDEEKRALGGYQMVVMEYLDGAVMTDLMNNNIRLERTLHHDITQAVKILHQQGLVFGDLRPPNILVEKVDGRQHAKLIDFDWCGINNQDKYPVSINAELSWPLGMGPNLPLMKAHDLELLARIAVICGWLATPSSL